MGNIKEDVKASAKWISQALQSSGYRADFSPESLWEIDRFFDELGLRPRVLMEASDTEAIKRMVESGFGYSILPEYALKGRNRFFQTLRVSGKRLVRRQALAMVDSGYPRTLTNSVAEFLRQSLATPAKTPQTNG